MKVLLATALLALAPASLANAATYRWTPAQATAKVKTWTTADPNAVRIVEANIEQEKAGANDPDRLARLEQSLESARHAATVTAARCAGAGRAVKGRFRSFRCSVTVAGKLRLPPDYELYKATKRLTVKVTGSSSFTVRAGWR